MEEGLATGNMGTIKKPLPQGIPAVFFNARIPFHIAVPYGNLQTGDGVDMEERNTLTIGYCNIASINAKKGRRKGGVKKSEKNTRVDIQKPRTWTTRLV